MLYNLKAILWYGSPLPTEYFLYGTPRVEGQQAQQPVDQHQEVVLRRELIIRALPYERQRNEELHLRRPAR